VFVGFMVIWAVATLTPIAWPWYCLIGGGATMSVGWIASRLLTGKQAEWSPYSIPGQRARFEASGAPTSIDGWSTVPGRIDRQSLWLIVYLGATIGGLALFERLIGS
jgi:SSS family solute:Na+ symporter